MTNEAMQKFMASDVFTPGEKTYVVDFLLGHGGSFTRYLFEAISRADWDNLRRLELGFPELVQGYRAYAHGDLTNRVKQVTGENIAIWNIRKW